MPLRNALPFVENGQLRAFAVYMPQNIRRREYVRATLVSIDEIEALRHQSWRANHKHSGVIVGDDEVDPLQDKVDHVVHRVGARAAQDGAVVEGNAAAGGPEI